jgi:hypothetical protein
MEIWGIQFLVNLVISSIAISACAAISKKDARLAGFLASMPLSTVLLLAFSYIEGKDAGRTTLLAKSILVGLPLSLMFFIPFFFAERLRLGFWQTYVAGIFFIALSFLIHRAVTGQMSP